ncbi:MAG: hypothetical protein AAB837_02985 [Patescibacteria group bacterium]
MKNKILYIIVLIIAVSSLFLISKNISLAPIDDNKPASAEAMAGKVKIDPDILGQTLPLSNAPKDVAWAVFSKYLAYNKVKNIEGVRSVVYKIASVCEDPKTRIDCEARMGLAYQYGVALKKEDFVNIWSDEKQIILATDFKIKEDDVSISRARAIIFFVRDENKNLEMLSFSPFKGAVASKDTTALRQEIDDRLIIYTQDKDQDGMADYNEECLGAVEKETCMQTNPKLRNTNDDGWWDGVEALMR